MQNSDRYSRLLTSFTAVLLAGSLAACGGGKDPILGTGAGLVVAPVAGSPGAPGVVPPVVTPPVVSPVVPPVVPPVVAPPVVVVPPVLVPTPQPLVVLSTAPDSNATAVCPSASINATFSIPSGQRLDPASVSALTFRVATAAPLSVPVLATTVTVDALTGRIATFVPSADLVPGLTYTATIDGGAAGVKDLATPANTLANTKVFNFTVGPATGACLRPVPLNRAQRFGIFGGTAGMTNNGINTVVTGAGGTTADIGTIATATSSITGFHDSPPSDIYTETGSDKGAVSGKILTCTTSTTGPTSTTVNPVACTAANNALLDAGVAYATLAALPPGLNPDPGSGHLGGLPLAPGVYKAAGGSFDLITTDLTLDGKGDANAVFVFQMASSLTVGAPGFPRSVILINGAQAKNVFWQVGSAATINMGGGGAMVGTIIAQSGVVISTVGSSILTTLAGRALSLIASVTMDNTVITVPLP